MRINIWRFSLLGLLAAFVLAGCPSTDSPAGNNGADAGLHEDSGDNSNNCVPECQVGARTCGEEQSVLRCESVDGCATFVEVLRCPSYKLCEGGTCVDKQSECTSVCTPGAGPRCNSAGEVEQCDDHDGNGCYEWGGAQTCASGEYCNPDTGACEAPSCSDECSAGETSCEGELVRTCAENAQGCLVFGAGTECPAEQTCQAGQCVEQTSCSDECTQNEAVCAADGGLRTCEDHDGDGCLEWSSAQACSSGQECRAGACVDSSSCRDECVDGETVCVGNKLADCADHDGDGCTEFPNPYDCPSGQTCSSASGTAACEGAPSTGTAVINEIFYDSVGPDLRTGGSSPASPTFIELKGTPGMDISGFAVELVNGSNGQPYNSFTLPSGASLDGNGFAVLAMDTPDSYLSYAASSYTNVYYVLTAYGNGTDALQNGQDSVVLKDASASTIDAVGYGDFSATPQNFAGEGSAVAATISGRSLGRVPGAADTDDNAADFVSFYPTPGLENTDLLINEVYPDQPGVDDATQTFIELVAPIQGWEDMPLDGYKVHAINGFDGLDYIFGPNGGDGISLAGANLNDAQSTDGYVVVCNIAAEISLLNACAVAYDGADLQNGPDNVVLRYNGRVIDAVGYGTFGSGETFVGEGDPISYSSSDAGQSLGRWPITDPSWQTDTDDNYMDFWWLSPTPGTANPRP
ncbi:lamin tail domain-containing protein [Persicimonas caeni]|uniref:Lamin tail domain-containing protein n=1 Tax=Persicimonas caeni TaxID=2292766 RepID=A0A4Y6PXD9_PERCE|nr:lamin tail domain-containing protein [Persicimonas caeni]QDG52976.1 lamin tail domain-containing protein [Persicimonas caeni]QED34198.1 lamin tail domain-containing protein [Persicimonas caeni]